MKLKNPRQPSFGGVLFAGPKVLLAASPLTFLALAGAFIFHVATFSDYHHRF